MKRGWTAILGCVLLGSVSASAYVIFQTGFEPSEGWSDGALDPAMAPTGTWTVSGTPYVAPDIETSAPYDYANRNMLPATGDGHMYMDRYREGTQSASAWVHVSDPDLKLWTIEVDYFLANTTGSPFVSLIALNRNNNVGTAAWLGAIGIQNTTGGARIAYRTTNAWVFTSTTAVVPFVENEAQWISLRLEFNETDTAYSAYYSYGGGDFNVIVEDTAYSHNPDSLPGDSIQAAYFSLGATNSVAAVDNLKISAIPEPAMLTLLLVPALFLLRRRIGSDAGRV